MTNDYYKLIFYTVAGDKIAEVTSVTGQNIVNSFSFELLESGCGAFSITLTRKDLDLRVGDVVEIYLMGEATPYFTGYMQHVPELGRTDNTFIYTGYGFIAKLDEIVINTTYTATEVSAIITSILENEIIPKKPEIRENLLKITATAYTVTKTDLTLTKAKKAINDLTTQAGDYVAGIDEAREFFFKARSSAIQQAAIKAIAIHLEEFNPSENNSGIANKIYIKIGKITAQSNYITSAQDLTSQAAYGIRENVVIMPTTDNITDAAAWGTRQIILKKDPVVTATITGIDILDLKERILAEGKARVLLQVV
jgi:hypothetical protein